MRRQNEEIISSVALPHVIRKLGKMSMIKQHTMLCGIFVLGTRAARQMQTLTNHTGLAKVKTNCILSQIQIEQDKGGCLV